MSTTDNKQERERRVKQAGAIAAGVVIVFFVAVWMAAFAWGMFETMTPVGIVFLCLLLPILIIAGIVYVVLERIKEIEGGEEDEASKY